LLRQVGSEESVQRLWALTQQSPPASGARCPVCDRPTAEVPLPVRSSSPPLRLDVCAGCQFVWFDPREFEQFPPAPRTEPRPLSAKSREAIALAEAQWVGKRAQEADADDPLPTETWHWIPGVLGLPVEENASAVKSWPWLTYGLAAALVAVYALTAQNLGAAVEAYGLVPAQLGRHGGLTLITAFFLHAGFWHLAVNVYFLLLFGDNVEDDLGWWRYAALLALADLVGNLVHVLGNPHSALPCIGASGGISGVIAYYALRFPHARIGFLFRCFPYFRWCHVPAYMALLFWFVLQFVLAAQQHLGQTNVAALAHLGGAAVGVAAWLLWRSGALHFA
jgi:membrane associated rhomboid family serine protease